MKRRVYSSLAPLAILLLAMLFAVGCVREPSMDLHGARLQQVDGQGLAIELTMSVRNNNSFDVQLRNVRVDVTIAKNFRLPHVMVSPNQWLPSGETTLVRVPVAVPWEMVMPMLQASLASPTIPYRAVGVADVSATRTLEIDVDDYAIDRDGTVSRDELLAAALRGGLNVSNLYAER
jgi:hypothetical protein